MRARICFALLLVLMAGCATRPVTPGATTPEPPPAPHPAPAGETPIRVALDSTLVRYQVESRTVVFAATDTTVPLDSIHVTARLSLTTRHAPTGAGIVFSGTVERLTVTSGIANAKTSQMLDGEFRLAWSTVADSILVATQPARSGCDQLQETARDLLVSVIPPLPETLTRDQSWRVVSQLRGCRAGLTLDVVSRSQVHVVSGAAPLNRQQVTLRSDGTQSITGTGTQGGSSVTLRGTGALTTNYLLDLADGVLRSTATQSNMQIEFDMGYRTDRLLQRTTRSITRVQ